MVANHLRMQLAVLHRYEAMTTLSLDVFRFSSLEASLSAFTAHEILVRRMLRKAPSQAACLCFPGIGLHRSVLRAQMLVEDMRTAASPASWFQHS
jgi:hypothetical protein